MTLLSEGDEVSPFYRAKTGLSSSAALAHIAKPLFILSASITMVVSSAIFAPLTSAQLEDQLVDGRDSNGVLISESDSLAGVELQSAEFDSATIALEDAFGGLADANRRLETSTEDVTSYQAELAALTELQDRAMVRVDKLSAEESVVREDVVLLMTRRFVDGSDEQIDLDGAVGLDERMERLQTARLEEAASELIDDAAQTVGSALARNQERLYELEADRLAAENNLETSRSNLRQAELDIAKLSSDVVRFNEAVKLARSAAFVGDTDMTLVAFDAYWRASEAMSELNPSCGIQWWALAGIGRTESRHGQHSGGVPAPDGDVANAITGIALDGTNDTKAIGDTDGGAIDGDPFTDRAVGPMQFIPSTWVRFATDLTGDGYSNPQNMYDSAMAAANYLCRYGPGLDRDDVLRRAFFGYNQSLTYVELVLERAHHYEEAVGEFQQVSR